MWVDGDMKGMPERAGPFGAIGTGMQSALVMLNYRELKPITPLREALYYAVEAKLHGETAPSVSEETDVVVMQPDKPDIQINDDDVENVLFQKIAIPNRPKDLSSKQVAYLNGLADLSGLPILQPPPTRQGAPDPHDPRRPDRDH
jgi:hypothetical protein